MEHCRVDVRREYKTIEFITGIRATRNAELMMAASTPSSQDTCSLCGAPLSSAQRHCPTCKADAGAPNVRRCRTDANLRALTARYDEARGRATSVGCSKEFDDLEAVLKEKSGVVVSMSAGTARKFVEDLNTIYVNYGQLVGGGMRRPATSEDDRQRCAVGALLFGSYANSIIYGVLSLTEKGLPTYGPIHCRLRSVAIEHRSSFLETNSYRFVGDHNVVPQDKLPLGYMACWGHRHSLVLAKLADRLSSGQSELEWQALLIHSDGSNRQNDDFVEAHIYEGFDVRAIESMVALDDKKLSRNDKMDVEIAISAFKRPEGQGK